MNTPQKQENQHQEHHCRFVSGRGLLKSTKTHIDCPCSGSRKIPWEFARRIGSNAKEIYLTVEMLPKFVKWHLWRIRRPFILITGDSIRSVSERDIDKHSLDRLLNNRYLTAWYAQNLDYDHPKLHPVPLGVDYHTLNAANRNGAHKWGGTLSPLEQEKTLLSLFAASTPLKERRTEAFANWHFAMNRGNREECLRLFPKELAWYQPEPLPRLQSWQLNVDYAFTMSPLGAGLDCHRTWEALLLGSIPIVVQSPIDPLYDGLPVVILKKWDEWTAERMKDELERIQQSTFNFNRLTLSYWRQKIGLASEREVRPPQRDQSLWEPMTFEAFRQVCHLSLKGHSEQDPAI